MNAEIAAALQNIAQSEFTVGEEIDAFFSEIYDVMQESQRWSIRDLANDNFHADGNDATQWGMSWRDALRCVVDTERTTRFISSIFHAVDEFKSEGVEHITAVETGVGTGLFLVAMAAAGVDNVIGFEINEESAAKAQNFVDATDFSDRITIRVGDATDAEVLGDVLYGESVNLYVSENMHTGMFFEPQVPLRKAMSPFLADNARVIPEQVVLSATLGNVDWNTIQRDDIEVYNIPDYPGPKDDYTELCLMDFRSGEFSQDEEVYGHLSVNGDTGMVNALFFQMDVRLGGKISLPPNTALFLGNDHAVKLPRAYTLNGDNNITFHYKPGCRPEEIKITIE